MELKRRLAILLCILMTMVTACAPADGKSVQTSFPSGWIDVLENRKWPDNQYTHGVPKPGAGAVERCWVDTKQEYCSIQMSGIGYDQMTVYLDALKKEGYQKIAEASEKIGQTGNISTNILLSNGKRAVSMAHYDQNMILCLTIEKG